MLIKEDIEAFALQFAQGDLATVDFQQIAEQALKAIEQAKKLERIRIILDFEDYYEAYGGLPQRIRDILDNNLFHQYYNQPYDPEIHEVE
jgi:RecJ-like exonuclease